MFNALAIVVTAGARYPAFGLRLNPMTASAAISLSSVGCDRSPFLVVSLSAVLTQFGGVSGASLRTIAARTNSLTQPITNPSPGLMIRVTRAVAPITGQQEGRAFKQPPGNRQIGSRHDQQRSYGADRNYCEQGRGIVGEPDR